MPSYTTRPFSSKSTPSCCPSHRYSDTIINLPVTLQGVKLKTLQTPGSADQWSPCPALNKRSTSAQHHSVVTRRIIVATRTHAHISGSAKSR
ncbi:hypothetical protein ElyMa_004408000 [Elysia marginata]|uniref:Uncharacterized protein n=1 Tax=Elysia marginata TaxID=1093978 RepID=A0AAV4HA75_9GAST|nr:hypothetical protein ElyMa_004408000 [Elysia marginata]